MSFDYASMAATADRLLGTGEFGRSVTFIRPGEAIVDGIAGTSIPGTPTTSTANVVVLPASKGTIEAFDNRREALSAAHRILRYLKVAASSIDFEPLPNDQVTMDSATWQVLGCTPVNPAGTPIVYGVGLVKL